VLRRHGLRTAVNRFAEAAALAAVAAAALYPILHLGRPWLFYWVLPYPATYQVWPQFRSTLVWDLWGIMSHVIVTSLVWYTGRSPTSRRCATRAARGGLLRAAYGWGARWRGSGGCHWRGHEAAYRWSRQLVCRCSFPRRRRGAGIRDDAGAGLAPGARAAAGRVTGIPSASASCSRSRVLLRTPRAALIDDAT
jgi:hypothetical protein